MTTAVRKRYLVTVPLTLTVWAYDEADALRQATQSFGTGFPQVVAVTEVTSGNRATRALS